ncbi:MAG: ABC transporter permease [Romboutsia sp.]
MSNLMILLKVNMINELGLNVIKNSKGKERNKILMTSLVILLCVGIFAVSIFKMCFLMSDMLIQINSMELLLIIGFIGGTLFALLTSIYKGPSYLFESRDFDMLSSLPIKSSTILTSKIAMIIGSNYIFSLIFILIPSIVYFIRVEASITYFLYLIILFLISPLIPIIISSIISLFIGSISSKIKHKNIVLSVGSIALLIGYMATITKIEVIAKSIIQNSVSIMDAVNKLYPPAYYFVDALKNNSLISLLIFIAISVIPFSIFIAVSSKQFEKINSKMKETYKVKNYKMKDTKTNSQIVALVKKEISRYLSSYIYFLNTSFGMIILLIGTIGICIFGVDKLNTLLELNIDMNIIKPQLLLMLVFIIATSCTTYCSISLEGKKLWILKSSPIDTMDIFKAKIGMNLILNTPISVICFFVISIKLKFDFLFIIIGTLSIISVALIVSVGGLLANLYFPNMDWKNEVEVVKRSVGIMIILFGTMIYVGLFAIIYYFMEVQNLSIYLVIFTAITMCINLIMWHIIKTKGIKVFNQI